MNRFYYDYKSEKDQGAYNFDFVRNLSIWNYVRDYFPIKIMKTKDLDSNRNYLFTLVIKIELKNQTRNKQTDI